MDQTLVKDARGAVSVEYLMLAGCVALATVFGFQSFGGAIDDKVQCQAASVASLSIDGCASASGTDSDFAGVDVSGSALAQDERDCGGWNAISCAVSAVGDFAADAGETFGDQVGNVLGDTVGNFVGDYAATAWQLPVSMVEGALPLVGLGGDGAAGVVDSWQATGKQLTALGCAGIPGACQTLNSGFVPGFEEGEVTQLQIDTGKSFVGWDYWANGEYGNASGTLLPNVALTIFGTKGVGSVGTGARVASHADVAAPTTLKAKAPTLGSPLDLPHYGRDYEPDYEGNNVEPLPGLPVLRMPEQYRGEHGRVRYITPETLAELEVHVKDGLLVGIDGKPYTSGKANRFLSDREHSVYVLSPDGHFYAYGAEKKFIFKHSSFLAGAPASGAGEIVVKNGRITKINNESGHYKPDLDATIATLRHLKSQGLDLSDAMVTTSELKHPVSATDLLAGNYERE